MEQTIGISAPALKVIALVKNAINNSITGVSFFSIRNYTNLNGEISNQLINVGINYETSKKQDIELLRNLNILDIFTQNSKLEIEKARTELILSFEKPNANQSQAQRDAYTHICSGVKVHNETGKMYIFGYSVGKTVIKEGVPTKNKGVMSAKDELRKLLKTSKYRQFSIEVGNTLRANGDTIEL